jgi:hypothetical protein
VHIYDANMQMVGMVLNTLLREFRQCHVFMGSQKDLLIVATDKEFTRGDLERAEKVLSENTAVRSSLETIHHSSLDTILLRELWPTSYIRSFCSDFGIQTMDYPRLHYMAGKTFFLGMEIEGNALLNNASIPFLSEHLLVKRYPRWADSPLESEIIRSFLESTRDLVNRGDFPMAPSVRLKAYLSNSRKFPLTAQEKQFFMVDLIPLITGGATSEDQWTKVGLKEASYRRKVEAMLSQASRHRNWIVPYSIDGLKTLLKEGMSKGADAYENNWCALQAASILMYERTDMVPIKALLDRLKRDKDGRVLLSKGDEGLQESIEMRLNKLAPSGR